MNVKKIAEIFTRYALAITFLSAVADRFGIWGRAGEPNIAWGNYANFVEYTALLTPWVPKTATPILGAAATFFEILFAVTLIIGFRLKETFLGSAILLLIFALSMAFTVGVKAPFDYSVFTASAAAFLLYSTYNEKA